MDNIKLYVISSCAGEGRERARLMRKMKDRGGKNSENIGAEKIWKQREKSKIAGENTKNTEILRGNCESM